MLGGVTPHNGKSEACWRKQRQGCEYAHKTAEAAQVADDGKIWSATTSVGVWLKP